MKVSRRDYDITTTLLEKLQQAGDPTYQAVCAAARCIEGASAKQRYLIRCLEHFRDFAEEAAKYKWLPVDIRTFVDSPLMLGIGDETYPEIKKQLEGVHSRRVDEVVLTGGIGTAKTSLAVILIAYELYLISCLKDPHQEFSLSRSSEIVFIFQSLNEKLARGVDYQRFKALLDSSPYFRTYFDYDRSRESQMDFASHVSVLPVGGAPTAAISRNVYGGLIDEMNFMAVVQDSKQTMDQGAFDQAKEIYNSIVRRRKSRFLSHGRLPGILCLVSSKKYPGEFTDEKMAEAREDSTIYVYDKRVWDIKPEGTFIGEWFPIFIGDETRMPRILTKSEMGQVDDSDQALIDWIPVEYKGEFERDMMSSLRDIAGHNTMAKHPFILNKEKMTACFGTVAAVGSRGDCDFKVTQLKLFQDRIASPKEPRFVHIDLGLTGDSCGLAIGHCAGFKAIQRSQDVDEIMPVVRYDLILEVRPPVNDEIQFHKVRALLYKLRELGMNIRWATLDSYQSTDMKQLLIKEGISAGLKSVDTDLLPYDLLKQAFYDGRVQAPEHEKARRELVQLERDPKRLKIDHPPTGSKDLADAMAGAAYGLTMRKETWVRWGVPMKHMPQSLKDQISSKA